jgi:hypothetical protein
MRKFSEAPVKGEGTQFNENHFVADLEPEHGHNVNYLFTHKFLSRASGKAGVNG